jgi:hypothetical protein
LIKLQNEDLYNLDPSSNIIGVICTVYSKTRNAALDTYKSAPSIRKQWPHYWEKYKEIITGHGEKKILKKCAVK